MSATAAPTLTRLTTLEPPISIRLQSETPQARIHYTTDGSTPTLYSRYVYSDGVITVADHTTVKAFAIALGLTASSVVSATYTTAAPAFATAPRVVATALDAATGDITVEIVDADGVTLTQLAWGDGTSQNTPRAATAYTHTYATAGRLYTLVLTWTQEQTTQTSTLQFYRTAALTPTTTPLVAAMPQAVHGYTGATPASTARPARFRYRGPRERVKWNGMTDGLDADTARFAQTIAGARGTLELHAYTLLYTGTTTWKALSYLGRLCAAKDAVRRLGLRHV